MNIQIKWPDAAVGAFVNGEDVIFARTMNRSDEIFEGMRLDRTEYRLPYRLWQWIERPAAEWDGQGLPPVGVECEAIHEGDGLHRVKVIGRDEDRTVFRWMEGPDKGCYGAYTIPICFRSLRTAEQLAAEQRKKAIDAMLTEIESTVGDWNHSIDAGAAMCAVVAALYDAGYRK